MTQGLASLPMYDWPELRSATDRLWSALRNALRDAAFSRPRPSAADVSP